MKASRISRLGITGALILFHLLVTLLFYYVAMPLAVPAGANFQAAPLAAMQRTLCIIGFVAAVITSIAIVLLISRFYPRGFLTNEITNAIRNPFLVLDSAHRLVRCNPAAERVLGLSSQRDAGRTVDKDILDALTRGPASIESVETRSVIQRGDRHYQITDNPIHATNGESGKCIVTLRDVTHYRRLREAITHINEAMQALVANTQKITDTSASLSSGATRQADSLSAISASLDEFSQKVQGNTESAEKSTQLAAQAREAAERSGKEIAHALTAMMDVQDAGIRIARIVKLIDDIAFQTNLLALNAAVEAARAGRQGKGFAVVAGEVRSLAGRSAKAAKDTATMVEDVTERIGNASNYISRLEEMLRNIVNDAIRMADSSASATAISSEQASAILEVNQELNQMNNATRATMSEAEQTASAVSAVSRQVREIQIMIQNVTSELDADGEDGDISQSSFGFVPKINLYAPPPPLTSHSTGGDSSFYDAGRFSGQDSASAANADDDFSEPFRKMSRNEDWGLNAAAADTDETLSDLLRSDGYKPYETLLRDFQNQQSPFKHDAVNGPTEYKTTADGDKVVKPDQSIHLDDKEFGRY